VGAILPIDAAGLTTRLPTVAVVLPVVDRATSTYRGAFVAEVDVSPAANINAEVAKLARGDTAEFLILDAQGTVYAAADTSLLAKKLDPEFASLGKGAHNVGNKLVIVDDIPSAGWRVMFRQDRATFESPLAQPIQDVGRLVVIVFLAVGAVMFVLLLRRLRAAREEQERLRRINEAQEEFISIVSHELRTPVAGVLGFLETSLDHWGTMSDAERQTTVRRAAVNARRLQALTRDVLDTQSVETGQLAYTFDSVDLAEETRVAVEAAVSLYRDRPIEVSAEPQPIRVAGDPNRLQQVLTNLIDNAHTNAPPGTVIEVSATTDDDGALVSVRDHGPGLPAEGFERVFDKFVRTGSSTVAGTGLGLYICRRIIEEHRGRIWAENAPDGGAVFSFRIPLRRAGAGNGDGDGGAAGAAPASTAPTPAR
jgi:signal transduction histidine kinase